MIKSFRKGTDSFFERKLLDQGYDSIIGIDEVGRGSWAGPVVVCGYKFMKDYNEIKGINDSKVLSKQKRNNLCNELKNDKYLVLEASAEDIDNYGINKVIERLIQQIILSYQGNSFFLIDGVFSAYFGDNSKKIINGDKLHYSISCASIIAKVYRDKLMFNLAKLYPQYFFERNAGYGTLKHRQALEQFGPCIIHRKTYKPIQQYKLGILSI